jgi:hypothetical protein
VDLGAPQGKGDVLRQPAVRPARAHQELVTAPDDELDLAVAVGRVDRELARLEQVSSEHLQVPGSSSRHGISRFQR